MERGRQNKGGREDSSEIYYTDRSDPNALLVSYFSVTEKGDVSRS